jgi:hypothetical protein
MPFVISGVSAFATFLLRGTGLFWPAMVNTVLCFWSLGILANFRGTPVADNYERIVGLISMVTSLTGFALLVIALFM